MRKYLKNNFGLWAAIIYSIATLFLGVFSIGSAFLASSAISGLFYTFILPAVLIGLVINFFVGYYSGILIEKIWRKIK